MVRRLNAVASLVVEHRLWEARTSAVAACGLSTEEGGAAALWRPDVVAVVLREATLKVASEDKVRTL